MGSLSRPIPACRATPHTWKERTRRNASCSRRSDCRLKTESVSRPLVAMISRLVDQKGIRSHGRDRRRLPSLGASFVLLGTGERRCEDLWRTLARYPDRIGARIGFDEALAHRIEAGADLFLMPSRFEPCGLNQIQPSLRRCGGARDRWPV